MRTSKLALSMGLGVWFGFTLLGQALALPSIGPAFEADAPVFVQEDKSVYDVGIATDGDRMFTVFEEGGHLRGMLTDNAGNALLPGMPYYVDAPVDGWNTNPSVAFGGSHYVLAYSSTPGIFVLRIGTDGAAVGQPIRVSETGYSPKIGWVGDQFIIVWNESDGMITEVAQTTVSSSGVVGETQIISVDAAGEPFLATNAGGALVTWAVYRDYDADVEAVLLDADGEIRTPEFLIEQGGNAWELRVASAGNDFLTAWSHNAGVRAVTVSPEGATSELLEVAEADGTSMLAVGGSAEGFVAAWQPYGLEQPSWTIRHISANGELGAPSTPPSYLGARDLALLGRDDGYWAVYREVGLFGVLTDHQFEATAEPTPLTLVKNSQDAAELFWNGSHYVLTWDDERFGDGTYTGRMVRVTTAGERQDADSIPLDDATDNFWHAAVPLADGKVLLGSLALNARRESLRIVNADGTLNPLIDLGAAGSMGGVSLAAHGERRLAVYDGEDGTVWGRLFDAQGAPLGEPHVLPLSGVYDVRAHAGADGFLLQVSSNSDGTGLAALRDDWTLGPTRKLNDGRFPVDVAVGAGETVVVWAYHDARRVARFWEGEDWAGEEFTLGPDGSWGDTEWDGTQFAAVWQDDSYHSHWTTFDRAGNVATPEPLFRDGPVSADPFATECNGPKLASNGEGQCLLTCVRYDRDYSRRLVNYMVQSDGSTPPDGETSATEASVGNTDTGAPSNSTAVTEGSTAAAPVTTTEPAISSEQTDVVTSDQGATSLASESSPATQTTTGTSSTTDTPAATPASCNVSLGSQRVDFRGLPLLLLAGLALGRRARRRK